MQSTGDMTTPRENNLEVAKSMNDCYSLEWNTSLVYVERQVSLQVSRVVLSTATNRIERLLMALVSQTEKEINGQAA